MGLVFTFIMNYRAQGTVEYLVILAVVVVISLVVVGIFTGMFSSSSQQVINSSSKLGNSSGSGISIVDAMLDVEGDSLIKLSNTSSDPITLTRISAGGVDNDFSEQVVGMDSKTFSLSDLTSGCRCSSGQKSVNCEYSITYTQNGIVKNSRINKTIDCVTDSVPVNPQSVVGLGSGTLTDPWVINNCSELQNMNKHLDGNYILGANIDCFSFANLNDGDGFEPVGKKYCVGHPEITNQSDCENYGECIHSQCPEEWWCDYEYDCENCVDYGEYGCSSPSGVWNPLGLVWVEQPFVGSFNGNNNQITNLKINRPTETYVGLFGYAKANISNLELVDLNIVGSECVGGIVGDYNNATLTNISSSGVIIGQSNYSGGVVGCLTNSTITNSNSTSDIVGNSGAGGLVGSQTNSNIINSYSEGDVTAGYQVGGLVGGLTSGTINNSYASGTVISDGFSVGGLAGATQGGLIIDSNFNGSVTGNSSVGGLVGYNYADINSSINNGNVFGTGSKIGGVVGNLGGGRIFASGSNGEVIGSSQVGGLAGEVNEYMAILESYSTGDVTGSSYVGGLIGAIPQCDGGVVISKSYSAGDVNGDSYVGGLIGNIGYAYSANNTISKSFALGNVYGVTSVGGFIGEAGSVVTSDSYCRGNVTRKSGASSYIGGFIGMNWLNSSIYSSYSTGSVIYLGATNPTNRGFSGSGSANLPLPAQRNCFWDVTTSGQSSNIYYPFMALGKNTTQMKTLSTYSGASWDIDSNATVMNNGYPFLGWQIGNSDHTWFIN